MSASSTLLPAPSPLTSSLEAKIAQLESSRAALESSLLSLRAHRTLSSIPTSNLEASQASPGSNSLASTIPNTTSPPTSLDLLNFTLSQSDLLSAHTQTRLHRLSSIPTTFHVLDPSKNTKQLGVRVDTLVDGRAHKPIYIFYDESGAVVRHTVPSYLWRGGDGGPRVVRARVLRWRRRKLWAEKIQKAAKGAQRVGDVREEWWRRVEEVEWDAAVTVVRVKWMSGVRAEMKVSEKGVVEMAAVMRKKGGRWRGVEVVLMGELRGLAERIGWVGEGPGLNAVKG
ncbi:hypothetical protein EX30DRAFT_392546 [Ascodesmis nigricans]|uniref:Cenp-O kinetochore centromere component n=1 Tax=Ascodesmis nigricans TaxID=341454 RepID=A0A4S2N7E8_9PEZI|nr:hypothetical protein EX30DRAFT_392546 [Ascodesmis nigricans]